MLMAYNRKGWPVAQIYKDEAISGWRWSVMGDRHGRTREKIGALRAAEALLDKAGASYEWRPRR